jgi:hypothetical protein
MRWCFLFGPFQGFDYEEGSFGNFLVTKLCKVRKSCKTATMETHFVLKFAFVNTVDTLLLLEHIYRAVAW